MLWQHGITDLDQISQLTRLAKRVVHQYVDLLPQKVRTRTPKPPHHSGVDEEGAPDLQNPQSVCPSPQ
jgi:hypothetical protein